MKEKVAAISILANVILAGGKITVGVFSNSAAILAGGIDSFVDIFSSVISYVGIRISGRPADKKHPYGHYKFEVLSGLIITIVLFLTGLFIILEAVREFKNPSSINVGYLVLGVMLLSALVNEIMARIKIYYGKKENSVSLLSDGVHSRVDVYASLVVLVGLFFTSYWIYVDSILSFIIGLYIIKESFSLGKIATDSLLDVSAGPEIEDKIKEIVESQNIKMDSLKTQKKGSSVTANLEISLPGNLNIEKATNISEELRKKLMQKILNLSYVAIQIKGTQLQTGFYKPAFGKGFGWQKKGRFVGQAEGASKEGPGGFCVCSSCGYKVSHQSGVPCSTIKCPKCNINLERK